jgi:predicted nucleic acid-binding protein
MSIFVDASITLPWYFEDEISQEAEAVFDYVAVNGAVVPAHWKLEVGNGFQTALRRGRLDAAYRAASLADLGLLPIEIDADSNARAWTETLAIADRFGLTTYDAAYLELAIRRQLTLATLDRRLKAAAREARLPDFL